LNTPQDVQTKSEAEEAAFLDATEVYLGVTIEDAGFTRAGFLAESYRWCATLVAVGPAEANEVLRSEVERSFPPDQVDLQYAFVLGANRLIEEHLCS
jgi:hypothetical protein